MIERRWTFAWAKSRAARGTARAALVFALVFTASLARADAPMSSTNQEVARGVVDGGGGTSVSTNYRVVGFVGEQVVATTAASTNDKIRAGAGEIFFFPGPATSLAAGAGVTASSATLSWLSPGYDGGLGALLPGTSYLIAASTSASAVLSYASPGVVAISTSGTNPGAGVGAADTGLFANTTSYVQLWTLDADGNISPASSSATVLTLANAPSPAALTFVAVQPDSVTVAWIALPASPPGTSSQTAEGYVVQASSSDFGVLGPGAPTFSSTTYSVLASTLTVGSVLNPLNLASTYYFQVGSLNWAGQANFTPLPRLVYQISQSTGLVNLGIDTSVALSTVCASSMVVTNVGNWPMTIELRASTATAGTPWSLSTSSAVETVLLRGVWNNAQPAPSAFATALTTTTVLSSAVSYAGNETGVQIPPGASATLWFQFFPPTSTVGPLAQALQVVAQPVYP